MTSPAVGTGIVAFIEARHDLIERWAMDALDPMARREAYLSKLAKRAIAEVAKDRAILALHQPDYVEDLFLSLAECTECEQPYPCQTVRLLAAIDADHPAYRPEWKPEAT